MAKKVARKKTAKKKVAKKKATRKPKTKAKEMLLVGSKVKAALRAHGVNVSGDAPEALNDVVHWYIDQAARRAGGNNRKTVRPHDFMA
jgi:histone H3/H4